MELLLSSVPSDLSIVFIQGANLRVGRYCYRCQMVHTFVVKGDTVYVSDTSATIVKSVGYHCIVIFE